MNMSRNFCAFSISSFVNIKAKTQCISEVINVFLFPQQWVPCLFPEPGVLESCVRHVISHLCQYTVPCPAELCNDQPTVQQCGFQFHSYSLSYWLSSAHYLSLNSGGTVTTKPPTGFLMIQLSLLRKHTAGPKVSDLNRISNTPLPCNLHAGCFKLLPKLCLFENMFS